MTHNVPKNSLKCTAKLSMCSLFLLSLYFNNTDRLSTLYPLPDTLSLNHLNLIRISRFYHAQFCCILFNNLKKKNRLTTSLTFCIRIMRRNQIFKRLEIILSSKSLINNGCIANTEDGACLLNTESSITQRKKSLSGLYYKHESVYIPGSNSIALFNNMRKTNFKLK